MEQPEKVDDSVRITISARAFAFFIGAAITGGAGFYGTFSPVLEQSTIRACYDNANYAIERAEKAVDRSRRLEEEQDRQDRRIQRAEAKIDVLIGQAQEAWHDSNTEARQGPR